MTSRILPCIVPLLLAAVASGDPGELFPGKGRDPASQPDARPVVVGPPPASQPAAKLPTSQPEVLTVKDIIAGIPGAFLARDADWKSNNATLAGMFAGKSIRLTRTECRLGLPLRIVGVVACPKAIKGRIAIDIEVDYDNRKYPLARLRKANQTAVISCTATISGISVSAVGDYEMSSLCIRCRADKVTGH